MRGSTMAMFGALAAMVNVGVGQDIPDQNLMVLPTKAKKSFGSKFKKRTVGKRTKSLKERSRRQKAKK